MKRIPMVLGAAVVVLGLSFALGSTGTSTNHSATSNASTLKRSSATVSPSAPALGKPSLAPGGTAYSPATGPSVGMVPPGVPTTVASLEQSASGGSTSSGSVADSSAGQTGVNIPTISPKVVKTGTIDLGVPKGQVSAAIDKIHELSRSMNLDISAEQTQESSTSPNGTITLRVPVDSFNNVITLIRKIQVTNAKGKPVVVNVRSVSSTGQDVTSQFADLDARIRATTTERDQMQLLLAQAKDINDILNVRDRLNAVQTELDQLQGQKALLADQTTYSTLTLTVSEDDGVPIGIIPVNANPDSGFAGAWHEAVRGFNGGLQRIIAGSGKTAVILGLVMILAMVARFGWRYRERRLGGGSSSLPTPPSAGASPSPAGA